MVLQASSGQPVRGPATVEVGKPVEEFHFGRRPSLPSKLPGGAGDRSVERGLVGRAGGIGSVRRPSPQKLVGLVRESEMLNRQPDLQILSDLRNANGSLDVS